MHTHRYEIIVHLFFSGCPWGNPSCQTDVQALFLCACLWVSVSQPRQIDLQALIFSVCTWTCRIEHRRRKQSQLLLRDGQWKHPCGGRPVPLIS
jgi:hypothetical protein